jgi:hypothetical protein
MKAWKRFDRFEFPTEDSNHSVDDPLPSKIEDPIFSGDSPKMGSEIRQSDGTIPDLSMLGALSDLRSLGLLSDLPSRRRILDIRTIKREFHNRHLIFKPDEIIVGETTDTKAKS